jgi:hypothetical protein
MNHKMAPIQQEVTLWLKKTDDKDFLRSDRNQRQVGKRSCHAMFRRDDASVSSYQIVIRQVMQEVFEIV